MAYSNQTSDRQSIRSGRREADQRMDARDAPERAAEHGADGRQQAGTDHERARPPCRETEYIASDRQKRHSSADLWPRVTLPKGNGATRRRGEKFAINAATGTGTMAVLFPVGAEKGRRWA